MITGSNLFGLAVTYKPRLTQFSKLIYATVVLNVCYKVFTLESSSGLIKSPIFDIDQYTKVSFGSTNREFLKKGVRMIS
jgi:hypothetical protein